MRTTILLLIASFVALFFIQGCVEPTPHVEAESSAMTDPGKEGKNLSCLVYEPNEAKFTKVMEKLLEHPQWADRPADLLAWEPEDIELLSQVTASSLGCVLPVLPKGKLFSPSDDKHFKSNAYNGSQGYCGLAALDANLPPDWVGSCINRVCYEHDGCYTHCGVGLGCYWTLQTQACDTPFFAGVADCVSCNFFCRLFLFIVQSSLNSSLRSSGCALANMQCEACPEEDPSCLCEALQDEDCASDDPCMVGSCDPEQGCVEVRSDDPWCNDAGCRQCNRFAPSAPQERRGCGLNAAYTTYDQWCDYNNRVPACGTLADWCLDPPSSELQDQCCADLPRFLECMDCCEQCPAARRPPQ